MMQPSKNMLRAAVTKAEQPYGNAIVKDLVKAIEKFQQRHDWLERCMLVMEINVAKAVLWERIRALRWMVA